VKRPILGLVLSGGKSRRLGQDKALLSFREGTNQLDWTLSLLDRFCDRLAVSCREDQLSVRGNAFGAVALPDDPELSGPIAGVVAGLKRAAGSPVLAVACDMPLLDASVIMRLVTQRDSNRLATCYVAEDGRPEPMCAIYESECLELLEKSARQGRKSLRRFLEQSAVAQIALNETQMLASANTAQDVEAIMNRMQIDD
jgi:molybdopterin-guanine dinucleotide biosynthesis protein A